MTNAIKTVKTPNYTVEQTASAVSQYLAGTTVESIGEMLGKSVKSIVAKLHREGVYKAKTYVSKSGAVPVTKNTYADKIASILNLNEADAESLTKANKSALVAIVGALEEAHPTDEGAA